MRRPPVNDAGFSLLEVMVSIAILAVALVVLVGISTNNIRATHHARKLTTATFLARAKMAELEDRVLLEGFVDNDEEEEGDFSDAGRGDFRFQTLIEKIELPTDVAQKAQEASQQQTQQAQTTGSSNPLMAMAGMMGGLMSTLIEPIRVGLEESVRRVTVRVLWDEPGRHGQQFEVITFMTDPAKLDMAVGAVGQAPGSAPAAGSAAGGNTTGAASGGRNTGAGATPPAPRGAR
jgi:prepilin-type N-terminal cleavage/methylation domain-containing protein